MAAKAQREDLQDKLSEELPGLRSQLRLPEKWGEYLQDKWNGGDLSMIVIGSHLREEARVL